MHLHLHLPLFPHYLLLQKLASNLHLHLHVSCHFICLASLVLYIRLSTLTFKFFTKSGTHIFAYGSLILLPLPPHLLVLILKPWNQAVAYEACDRKKPKNIWDVLKKACLVWLKRLQGVRQIARLKQQRFLSFTF